MNKINIRALRTELLNKGCGYMWVGNDKYLSKSWYNFCNNFLGVKFAEVNAENVQKYIDYLFRS